MATVSHFTGQLRVEFGTLDCVESYRLLSFTFDRKPAAFVLTTYNPNRHYNHFLFKRNAGVRANATHALRRALLIGKFSRLMTKVMRDSSVESAIDSIDTRAVQHIKGLIQDVIHQRPKNVRCLIGRACCQTMVRFVKKQSLSKQCDSTRSCSSEAVLCLYI